MSTRERIPFAFALVFSLLFCAGAAGVFFFADPYDRYVISDAEAGMRRNTSAQTICAHLNSTAGSDHISGTVDVYYHNNSSFVSVGTATHQNLSAGIWCIDATADATNYDLVKVLWKSTGAITLLQTYPTTGWNDNATIPDVNVTKVNGTTQTGADLGAGIATTNAHLVGTIAAGTHEAQTGDSFAHVNSTTYGLSAQHANQTAIMGSGFLTSTDSLESIRNRGDLAWTTGAGAAADKAYVPSAGPTVTQPTTGGYVVGDYTALAHVDGTLLTVREEASANPGIDFYLTFAGDADVAPASLIVWGYYSGNVSHNISVQAGVSGGVAAWEDIGSITNGTAVGVYTFPLTAQHINATSGAANVRFVHNAVAGVSSHYLYLDKVLFEATSHTEAAPDAATVAAEVWNTPAASHTASSIMGGVLNDVPTAAETDAELSGKHGPGPWAK